MRTTTLIVTTALSLAACDRPAAEPRTVHFFEAHAAERTDVIGKCRSSDRRYEPEAECANALRAQRQIDLDHDAGGRH